MTAAGRPERGVLSIGMVLSQLRADFPEVTISKIRFLESEGLVRPARTRSGYRQFSERDVERLRFVLRAQRDHCLPLKVIKEQLVAADRTAEPMATVRDLSPRLPRAAAGHGMPTASDFASGGEMRLTREEMLAAADITHALLVEMEQYGLVRPGPAGFYDTDAVEIARTVRSVTAFGIEPRHLRVLRSAADRQVDLLTQAVTPIARQRVPDASARAEETLRELAALSVGLHALLVKTGLRDVIGR